MDLGNIRNGCSKLCQKNWGSASSIRFSFGRPPQSGQKVFKLVKWPNEFHEDPMILANALRFSLQVGGLEMAYC